MKAVLITKDNINYLGSRYALEYPDEELEVGMYLVADFGDDDIFEVLTKEKLDADFVRIEDKRPVLNGFFTIEEKSRI